VFSKAAAIWIVDKIKVGGLRSLSKDDDFVVRTSVFEARCTEITSAGIHEISFYVKAI
jgi:hypothetical protein